MFDASITFQRHQFTLNAELHLKKGSITALIGASGSGKSSLFRVLSGLETPLTGQIYSDDTCWFDADRQVNLAVQHRKVGMVFQDYALFEHLSVYENIAYGVAKFEAAAQSQMVFDWLKRINLGHKADAYPQTLSGGEKQRVALARALAAEPDILFLDEPFSALDSAIRHDLRRELQRLISDAQIPVLIATHDLLEARFLADTVYVLADGNIIQHGPTASVFKKPETVLAATVLGWQNILRITSFDENHIRGPWGELTYSTSIMQSLNSSAVAIPLEALTIVAPTSTSANTFTATVTHSANMGSYILIEAELNDGKCIVLRQSAETPLKPGDILSVAVDVSRLVLLAN